MQIIANRYQIISEIGSGGMGTVYKGNDTHTQRAVAIKHLKPEMSQSDLIARFKREGEALRELNHPNIVALVDAVEVDNQHYLIIEYMPSGDLKQLLGRGRLPIDQAVQIAIDIGDALTRAHRLNIIHRDLKPANVLIAEDGTPRLTDFGVAYAVNKERLTEGNILVGTVDYLPPEALKGETIDVRADIWAFGVMLFEMLAGEKPFKGDTLSAVMTAIMTRPVPDLEALRPGAPIALVDLIYRMLEKDRNARIYSVRQVGLELENILQSRDSTALLTRFDPTPVGETLTQRQRRHNLPAQITPFVGREAELAELSKLLTDPDIRLITIVAPGGVGKTRLALELAARAAGVSQSADFRGPGMVYRDGMYVVELASLAEPTSIIPAIADAIDYQFQPDGREQKQQILDFLEHQNLLLVLDNFEHLLAGATVVTDILKSAPHVQIIATSRQRLNQPGESLFHLTGLDFPDWETPEDALQYASVKLFMNSATRGQPGFELTADNLDSVARICRLVEGMPLGIILAAAWVVMLSPEEIADEIEEGIDFLETEGGEVPERQRSIRAVLDYSWHMMSAAEQQVFMKLSVFRAGFTREAAQTITGAKLRQLMALVNKSLIRRNRDNGRYEIHELLRQYAEEQLEASGQMTEVRDQHAQFYFQLAQETFKTRHRYELLPKLKIDYDNLIAALHWLVSSGSYEIASQFSRAILIVWDVVQSRAGEGFQWAKRIRQSGENLSKGERMLLLTAGARLAFIIGRYQENVEWCEAAIQLARELDDEVALANALRHLAPGANTIGEIDRALKSLQEALAIVKRIGDNLGIHRTLLYLGETYRLIEDYARAEASYEESLQIAREHGYDSDYVASILLTNLSAVTCFQGKFKEARQYLRETIPITMTPEKHLSINYATCAAFIKARTSHEKQAMQLLGLVQAEQDKIGIPFQTNEAKEIGETLDLLRNQLGEEAFQEAWNHGKSMDLDTVVKDLLAELNDMHGN